MTSHTTKNNFSFPCRPRTLTITKKIVSEKKPTLTQTYETKRKSWHDVQNKRTNKQTFTHIHTHFDVNQGFENHKFLQPLIKTPPLLTY